MFAYVLLVCLENQASHLHLIDPIDECIDEDIRELFSLNYLTASPGRPRNPGAPALPGGPAIPGAKQK